VLSSQVFGLILLTGPEPELVFAYRAITISNPMCQNPLFKLWMLLKIFYLDVTRVCGKFYYVPFLSLLQCLFIIVLDFGHYMPDNANLFLQTFINWDCSNERLVNSTKSQDAINLEFQMIIALRNGNILSWKIICKK